MSVDQSRVIKYLSQGIGTKQIADALGCDESYISQLRSDPDIQAKVEELQANYAVKDASFDEALDRAEEMALERIEKTLPFANTSQALAAFRILNTARRRKDGPVTPEVHVTNVVLQLPAAAAPRYILNDRSEIVEVEGKTMVAANPHQLPALLEKKTGKTLLPTVTDLDKAATRLAVLSPTGRAPRKLPSLPPSYKLTPDMI